MDRPYLKIILFLLIVLDIGYSFKQYYDMPIDGDLVPLILPSERNATILEQPFGLKAIREGVQYPGVNRYFSHKSLALYFRNVPLWLQGLLSPVDSIYASAALIKIAVHILLAMVLCFYVFPDKHLFSISFLSCFLFFTTLFQAHGYFHVMGVIDGAATYLFFYALPLTALLYFFYPFYKSIVQPESFSGFGWLSRAVALVLAVSLPLSGPLVAPLGILGVPLIFLGIGLWGYRQGGRTMFTSWKALPLDFWIFLSLFFAMCLYAYYLGQYNAENKNLLPFGESLQRMGSALAFIFSSKIGMPVLLSLLVGNFIWLLSRKQVVAADWRFLSGLWLVLLIYLLLLPLGGFRDYRPNILRYDTFMPITLGLLFTLGWSSRLVFRTIEKAKRWRYGSILAIIALIFTAADFYGMNMNQCEREALEQLSRAESSPQTLVADCPILNWGRVNKPEESELVSIQLYRWNVTRDTVLFVQE